MSLAKERVFNVVALGMAVKAIDAAYHQQAETTRLLRKSLHNHRLHNSLRVRGLIKNDASLFSLSQDFRENPC